MPPVQQLQGVPADSPSVEKTSDGQAQNSSGTADQSPVPIRIVEDPEKAESAERRADDSAQREKDDLAAQQSMAESTKNIVVISWSQVGLATFGTFLVFVSLGLAFWSNWLTRKAVKITEETAERQLRAYAFVTNAEIANLDGRAPLKVSVTMKNSGQTPAYKLWVSGGISIMPYPSDEPFPEPQLERWTSGGVAPAGLKWHYIEDGPMLSEGHMKEIEAGRAAIYAFGTIRYVDAFKRERFSNFRTIVGGNAPARSHKKNGVMVSRMAFCDEGNESDQYP